MIPETSNSVIRHAKQPLVILRADYLKIAQGNHCAAKLLSVFEHWANWFVLENKPPGWVKLTNEALIAHLLGQHGEKQIRCAIKLLVDLGFIKQEKRRARLYDQSWYYQMVIPKVQEAIDEIALSVQLEITEKPEQLIPDDLKENPRSFVLKERSKAEEWLSNIPKDASSKEILTKIAITVDEELSEYFLNLNYKAFLKTEYWCWVRQAALRRGGKRCEICFSRRELQVHHKSYAHRGKEHLHIEDLQVLCAPCHKQIHASELIML